MEYGSLLGDVAWFSQGVPKWPVQIQEARRPSRNGDLLHQSQCDGRHAGGFDFPCEQSHGPRAERSRRNEKHQIHAPVTNPPRDLFDRRNELPSAPHQTEPVVIVGHLSDDPFGLKFPETLDGKHQVDVF